ncbi:nucleotidyltransferase domain-containing protein [Hyperthermus butylicus]|uniref:nucleotidyltransferase domain-containing protein n=1 Tax=Hyperthermus butylicus TaxID=54248 RepID=UPI000320AE85|nr:nucleotidyltransferase domain-containing protein [Hyperthermus butylicus]
MLLEVMLERASLLKSWRQLVKKAVDAIKEVCPEAHVYITGSIVKGEWIAASDIDLIIVLTREPDMREAARIIEHVWKKLGLLHTHPLEIHVTGPEGLERYKRKGVLVQLA